MNGTLRLFLLLVALVLVSVISLNIPLPGKTTFAGKADDKLVIISPHWDGIRNEFGDAFASLYKRETGRTIALDWLDPGGTNDCVRYVLSEFKRNPAGIGIDVFFGGGTDPFLLMKNGGMLAPLTLDSSVIGPIPQAIGGINLFDPDHRWYGAVLSSFGISYNKWVARKLGFAVPTSWKDLADPMLFSWVGAADPRNSGTMHLMFEIIVQAYGWNNGWRILTGIAGNAKTFSNNASEIPPMVAKGDLAFGMAIDMYGWAAVAGAGEDKVGFVLPTNLTITSADAIAMLTGAPHPAAAKRFIEFVLSEQGQKLWFLRKGTPGGPVRQELDRMPILAGLYDKFAGQTAVHGNPFATAGGFHFDNALASRRWVVFNDLLGAALIDHGRELRTAWKPNATAGDPAWASMPITEVECMRLAVHDWQDPVKKNREMLRWQKFFTAKYEALALEHRESEPGKRP